MKLRSIRSRAEHDLRVASIVIKKAATKIPWIATLSICGALLGHGISMIYCLQHRIDSPGLIFTQTVMGSLIGMVTGVAVDVVWPRFAGNASVELRVWIFVGLSLLLLVLVYTQVIVPNFFDVPR